MPVPLVGVRLAAATPAPSASRAGRLVGRDGGMVAGRDVEDDSGGRCTRAGTRPEAPARGALVLSGARGATGAGESGCSPESGTSIAASRTDGRVGRPDCGVKLGGGVRLGVGSGDMRFQVRGAGGPRWLWSVPGTG